MRIDLIMIVAMLNHWIPSTKLVPYLYPLSESTQQQRHDDKHSGELSVDPASSPIWPTQGTASCHERGPGVVNFSYFLFFHKTQEFTVISRLVFISFLCYFITPPNPPNFWPLLKKNTEPASQPASRTGMPLAGSGDFDADDWCSGIW